MAIDTTRRGILKAGGLVVVASALGCATPPPQHSTPQHATSGATAPSQPMKSAELRAAMHKLWEDHITYTRNFIISALAGLDDTQSVTERLLRNQDDIGNAIKPLYGDSAGTKLSALLRDHILIAAEIVKAAKASDSAGVDGGQKKWRGNADDIAAFLSGANPHWNNAALRDMLYRHLDFTTTEVVSRLKKDYAADIKAYDQGHAHMLMFADVLTDGIVRQFPGKFAVASG
jgi:hypothetical protein